jgi:hypothetical protein
MRAYWERQAAKPRIMLVHAWRKPFGIQRAAH